MHRDCDLNRTVTRQLLQKWFVQKRSVGGKAKGVLHKPPPNHFQDFEKLGMQKGLAFGDATGETVAEAQLLTALFHKRQLVFDVFDIAHDTPVDVEWVQVVGAKEATAVANCADG